MMIWQRRFCADNIGPDWLMTSKLLPILYQHDVRQMGQYA